MTNSSAPQSDDRSSQAEWAIDFAALDPAAWAGREGEVALAVERAEAMRTALARPGEHTLPTHARVPPAGARRA